MSLTGSRFERQPTWLSHQPEVATLVRRTRNRPSQAWVSFLVLDFGPVRRREASIQDLAIGLGQNDLARLTDEMCELQLAIIDDAIDEDVVFVPEDPEANDQFAARPEDVSLAWTLGHVVVHTTATSEESAALALVLARDLHVEGRSRYEVPWEDVRTVEFLRHRIAESRRMRLAMLAAWPDQPHLDNFYAPYEGRPPMNAVGRFLAGLAHDDSHIEQMKKILRQAIQSRAVDRRHRQ